MRVAFLFKSHVFPYKPAFTLFSKLTTEERRSLNTYVRSGEWNFHNGLLNNSENTSYEQRVLLEKILFSQNGNTSRLARESAFYVLLFEKIYTIQFETIRRGLALQLHRRLQEDDDYLGFIQVLPQGRLHHKVFCGCRHNYQFERGKLFILYSEEVESEKSYAVEQIKWAKKQFSTSTDELVFVEVISKRDIGARFSIFDAHEGTEIEFQTLKTILFLQDEWNSNLENTIYKLRDVSPSALEHLLTATSVLSKASLSTADGSTIAVNLRRCIEEITQVFCSPEKNDKPGWVKKSWVKFVDEITDENEREKYKNYLSSEISGVDSAIGRLEMLYKLTHKGVHESPDPREFSVVALRLILILNDLLSLYKGNTFVKLEKNIFQFMQELSGDE